MQRWEYTAVFISYEKQKKEFHLLNRLGLEGWELVSAVGHIDRASGHFHMAISQGITHILKRPV